MSDRDLDGVRTTLSDEFVFEQAFTTDGLVAQVEGADTFVDHLARYIGRKSGCYSQWEFHDIEVFETATPGHVFAEWRSQATVAQTGAAYSNVYVGHFRVAGSSIETMREYRDPGRVKAALDPQ